MKSFNKTMGYLMGFFFLMATLSVVVALSYIERHDLSVNNLFSQSTSLRYSDHWDIDFFPDILSSSHRSDNYETLTLSDQETFDLVDQLFISTSVEDVHFIEEEREDILVEYFREQPDTNRYTTNFNTQLKNNQLSVTTTLSIRNLVMTQDYKGTINVHIPKDYHFKEVKLDSDTTRLTNDNIYQNTDKLILITDLGDIDISLTQDIKEVGIFCDLGSISLDSQSQLGFLEVNNNLGDIDLSLMSVDMLKVNADLGSIEADMNLDEDTVIYADTDLGSVNSDYKLTTTSSGSNYSFYSNLGSIEINKIQ
ncbi:DUF4097 family beta strand repeat-containing protein [Vallitaleaceae bacterium 9-2]